MASIAERKNKNTGEVISYQIKVSRGRDPITKKQLTPYTMTWTPPEGWSKRAIDRELQKVACEFEMKCKNGEIKTKEERREQILEDRKIPTFRQYADTFMNEKGSILTATTIENYRHILERAAASFLGDLKMTDITKLDMKKYISDMQNEGRNEKTGERYKYLTVQKHYICLKSFFNNAVENEIIIKNPMDKMKRPQPLQDEEIKEVDAFTEKETKHILECADKEPLMWRCYIYLSLDSGCRRGELVALKWEDIDFTTGECKIFKSAEYTVDKGTFIGTTKTKKSRTIYINPPVLTLLKQWQNEQRKLLFKNGFNNQGYIFINEFTGELLNPQRPTSYFRSFGKRYKIENFHPHKLRHTMATLSIMNGADVVSVSKKLGHSRPSITLDVYTTATDEAQKRTNQILADTIYKEA